MPIYEYRCESCGYELEAMQKIADAPLTGCPECGEARLKKLISAAGFRLKGGGWYETDFKKGGSKRNLHETQQPKGDKEQPKGDKGEGKKAPEAKGKDAGVKKKETTATS